MKVKIKVTFRQYLRLLFILTYQRPIMKVLLGVAGLLILWIVFYYLDFFHLPEPIIYQYLTLALIVIAQPIVIYTTIHSIYYSSYHLRETVEMEIMEKEIKIVGESFYLVVKWHRNFKIVETSKWFLIYQNKLSAIIIPKKDLLEIDIEAFREILKNVVKVPVELIA